MHICMHGAAHTSIVRVRRAAFFIRSLLSPRVASKAGGMPAYVCMCMLAYAYGCRCLLSPRVASKAGGMPAAHMSTCMHVYACVCLHIGEWPVGTVLDCV